jgi:hypothetical protein
MIGRAERHVSLSAHAHHLARFAKAIGAAQERGVWFDIICFGKVRLTLRNGRLLQHASTEGVVYRHHQARHLAVVVDSRDVLWALAPGGDDWDATVTTDALFVALVKGYVQHDLYVQQMHADFPKELAARYGPGLGRLTRPAKERPAR